MRAIIIGISCIGMLMLSEGTARAEEAKATSLDELLQRVKQGWKSENVELKQREQEFIAAREDQMKLLEDAEAELIAVQKRSESLEQQFDQNKVKTEELEKTLKMRLGTMGELFGVIRQVAGDTRSNIDGSVVSAQYGGRGDSLEKLATSKSLPSVKELEHLWYMLQHEMTESGKVVRFKAPVVSSKGEEKEQSVVRVGVFNAVSDGKFLTWMPDMRKLVELGRQPGSRYLTTVGDLEDAKSGMVTFAVDPSRGAVLSVLVQTPGFQERIHYGGVIGYIIIVLGILTIVLGLMRLAYLGVVSFKVQHQRSSKAVKTNNPLGRVINVYEQNRETDTETLGLKLDEAILRESSKLERALWAVKIVSVVSPLLGLLGTVTGMIQTFQAITLFGTGDPKLMAGGISEALVTTMLGLMVAIPLVLLHAGLRSICKRVIDVLEEQSAGIIAKRAEEAR